MKERSNPAVLWETQLCRNYQRSEKTSCVFFHNWWLYLWFALHWQIAWNTIQPKKYWYLSSANAIIVVGMKESVFLNASRSNPREKKNRKPEPERADFSVRFEDMPIMRKAFRILLFLARVVTNPKAFKDTLEVRLPHEAAQHWFY